MKPSRKKERVIKENKQKKRKGPRAQRASSASISFAGPLVTARIVRTAIESSFVQYSVWTISPLFRFLLILLIDPLIHFSLFCQDSPDSSDPWNTKLGGNKNFIRNLYNIFLIIYRLLHSDTSLELLNSAIFFNKLFKFNNTWHFLDPKIPFFLISSSKILKLSDFTTLRSFVLLVLRERFSYFKSLSSEMLFRKMGKRERNRSRRDFWNDMRRGGLCAIMHLSRAFIPTCRSRNRKFRARKETASPRHSVFIQRNRQSAHAVCRFFDY